MALARSLSRSGEAGKTARKRLAEHITNTFFKDKAATTSVSCDQWRGFAAGLSGDIPAETRAVWAGKLLPAYAGSQAAVRSLKPTEIRALAEALGSLGGMREVSILTDRVASARSLKPEATLSLAGLLSRYGKAGKPARRRLGEYVTTTYLADRVVTRSVGCSTWQGFAGQLNKDLSAEARALWVSRLRAAFAEDTATLRLLKPGDFRSLIDTLKQLGDAKSSNLVAKWVMRN